MSTVLEIMFIYFEEKNFTNVACITFRCIGLLLHFLIREENSISADSGKFRNAGDFVTLVCDAERDCEVHTFSCQSRESASKCIS